MSGDTARLSIISNTGAYPNVTWTVATVETGTPDTETEVESGGYTTTRTSLTIECSEVATYHITAVESSDETITDEFTFEVVAMPGTEIATGYFGIPADEDDGSPESTLYINGATVGSYEYEGAFVTDVAEAVSVTISSLSDVNATDAAESAAYYLSFRYEGTTHFITIITTDKGYQNLSYSSTAAPLYWDSTDSIWTNAAGTYFLCYNSIWDCLYASAVSTYGPNSENAAPSAHFITANTNDGDGGDQNP